MVVHPDALRARRATPATVQAAQILRQLHALRGQRQTPAKLLTAKRAADLIEDIRAGRDAR